MEKLRLELDELRLQSFITSDALSQHRGTVNGHENPTEGVDCTAGDTCFATCALSCACNTGDCTALCESDACTYDQCIQEAGYITFIGSGG
ncbi:MAG TPA: pinensin family lanthipeptide [Longimicrobiaceae bacterium]|nr:pinensin family lanthipeptide [Longimicrobiaceae bacterium]